jgi:hypothetical protein
MVVRAEPIWEAVETVQGYFVSWRSEQQQQQQQARSKLEELRSRPLKTLTPDLKTYVCCNVVT